MEIKPKRANFNISHTELNITGYTIYTNSLVTGDGNRGCALYVRDNIESQQIVFENYKFSDSVWAEINLIGNDKLLVGCVYRSPNSSNVNNVALN